MKRNAFGQLIHPYIRFADGGDPGGGGKEYTPPATQEDLQKIIDGAVARTHQKYEGHEDLKAKAQKWEAHEAAEAAKGKSSAAATDSGPTDEDVQKRIDDALAAERLRSGSKLVSLELDKALEGRTVEPSKLIGFDRTAFVTAEGDVDKAKLTDWVKTNTTEAPQRRRDPSQGQRDARTDGGSVATGRDLYLERHGKKSNT
jgi:hypothetical protein